MLRNDRGLGIVGALVAMFVVTVALLAILACYRQVVAVSVSARNYTNAAYLAQQVLEELKKNDGEIESSDDFDTTTSFTNPQTITIDGVAYTIAWVQNSTVNNTIPVAVTISWSEGTVIKSKEFTDYYYLVPGSS